jgi:hypothetical protein
MILLNRHAIPPYTFIDYREWIFPTQQFGFLSWIKGAIAVYFYALLFFKFSDKLSYKKLICIFLLSFVVMYVPHIPLAISEKFSQTFFLGWVSTGISFFGVLMMFASIIFLLDKLTSFNKIFRKTVHIILLILLFFTTVFVQEANTGMTNDFKRSKLRTDAVDDLLAFYEIRNGEIYYLKNLHKNTSILSHESVPPDFWGTYFERKSGIRINAYEDYEKLYNDYSKKDTTIRLVFFEQSEQGNDMILSIVKCQGTQLTPNIEDVKSDAIDVGYYSENKRFALSILSETICNVMVNDSLMYSISTFHYANIQSHRRKPVTYFSINGNKLIYNTLMIKNIPFENIDLIVVAK